MAHTMISEQKLHLQKKKKEQHMKNGELQYMKLLPGIKYPSSHS